jgi:hypothetical protein
MKSIMDEYACYAKYNRYRLNNTLVSSVSSGPLRATAPSPSRRGASRRIPAAQIVRATAAVVREGVCLIARTTTLRRHRGMRVNAGALLRRGLVGKFARPRRTTTSHDHVARPRRTTTSHDHVGSRRAVETAPGGPRCAPPRNPPPRVTERITGMSIHACREMWRFGQD